MRVPRTACVRRDLLPTRSHVIGSRTVYSAVGFAGGNSSLVRPSGLGCELLCNALPEPLRSICKAAC